MGIGKKSSSNLSGRSDPVATCPDCGVILTDPATGMQEKAPVVCLDCLKLATPEPSNGWPILARWVSLTRGRGVFAREDIARDQLVERCWVMPLSVEESAASLKMPILNRYLFPWVNNQRVLISGQGLLYNFDTITATGRECNIDCILRVGISAIEFRSLRDIREGEELTWNYHRAKIKSR